MALVTSVTSLFNKDNSYYSHQMVCAEKTIMHSLKHFIMTVVLLTSSISAVAVEKPKYAVLHAKDKIEYRSYEGYVVAQTTVTDKNSYGQAATSGFMTLFDYISGENVSKTAISMTAPVKQIPLAAVESEKIAMTAPVQQSKNELGWSVAFMLPSEFNIDTAPIPNNESILLKEIPPRLMAVIQYSGRWTQRNFDKQSALLKSAIQEQGIEIISAAESAVYNPPFMPPFMRRNEVMFEVGGHPGDNPTTIDK
jgi:hypothetical protein